MNPRPTKRTPPARRRVRRARSVVADPAPPDARSAADLGLRWPAEWEAHAATWLAWPHEASDWAGRFGAIPWVHGEIVRRLVPGERVRILVRDEAHEAAAAELLRRLGVDLGQVDFHRIPTESAWARDVGPVYLKGADGEVAVSGWSDAVPARIAAAQGRRRLVPTWNGRGVVLEGGALDGNGEGTLLATEEWLLADVQPRNPGMSREDLEACLGAALGARKVLWLGQGIAGGAAYGHADSVARFVGPSTVVLAQEEDPKDENSERLRDALDRLQAATDQDDRPLRVVPLPMPRAVLLDGTRLPASYADFYVGNSVVLCPTFNDPADRVALTTLAELFPTRQAIGVHALDLAAAGRGTIRHAVLPEPA